MEEKQNITMSWGKFFWYMFALTIVFNVLFFIIIPEDFTRYAVAITFCFILAIILYGIDKWLMPTTDIIKEIVEKQNYALAIFLGSLIISLSLLLKGS
jgi:hypothetical protein